MGENAGRFQKGVSGNPGGRPREIGEIRDLARVDTSDAIDALHGIAVDLTAPALICPLPSGPGTIILEPWREIWNGTQASA